MPVLDTDILSLIQRETAPQYGRLLHRLDGLPAGSTVYVTVVSFEEQLRGWLEYIKRAAPAALPKAYAKLQQLNHDFSTRPVLPFDENAVTIYDGLLKAGTGVAKMDLRIAAICIAKNELLVSANLRDFRKVPGLKVEDWSA